MAMVQGRTHSWIRSSYSGGNGACVEVRSSAWDLLAVRDSKNPGGPRLGFRAASWRLFLDAMGGRALER